MNRRTVLSMAWALALSLALAAPALAQKGSAGKAHDQSTLKGLETQLKALDLTPEQRQKVDDVLAQNRPDAHNLAADLRTAKKANDEKALAAGRERAKALRAKVFAEIRPILTPEQLKKLKHSKKH
jgi:Spy/CpxP family protein refolding chaperone